MVVYNMVIAVLLRPFTKHYHLNLHFWFSNSLVTFSQLQLFILLELTCPLWFCHCQKWISCISFVAFNYLSVNIPSYTGRSPSLPKPVCREQKVLFVWPVIPWGSAGRRCISSAGERAHTQEHGILKQQQNCYLAHPALPCLVGSIPMCCHLSSPQTFWYSVPSILV